MEKVEMPFAVMKKVDNVETKVDAFAEVSDAFILCGKLNFAGTNIFQKMAGGGTHYYVKDLTTDKVVNDPNGNLYFKLEFEQPFTGSIDSGGRR